MKIKHLLLAGVILIMMISCSKKEAEGDQNPFYVKWDTPFETPPFDKIKPDHYMPAFKEGMKQEKEEVNAIVNNTEEPTFANTIDALEKSGKLLNKVNNVFGNLVGSIKDSALNAIEKEVNPLLTQHQDDINFNEKLFAKVKTIYDKKDQLGLTPEQLTVLTKYYKGFVRSGANLTAEQKEEMRKINTEFTDLTTKFGDNVLAENKKFELVIDKKEDLEGLSEGIIAAASETAKEIGKEGKWVFTIDKPSMLPFLTYSKKRELREKIFKAYVMKGDNDNELDNKKILSRIAVLRVKRANLLGYKTFADFVLEERMAKTAENVYGLLNKVWQPGLKVAKQEAADIQAMIKKEGGKFKVEPWDWWYYSEKVKMEKYALDEEQLRPYFKLENVRQGAFDVAGKLWGITFTKRNDIPVYHKDVEVFEVKEADGSHIGILFTDYFPRSGQKNPGAWMNSFRKQSNLGEKITPVIVNVGNFTKPTADTPSLLSVDEASTLFHEFGHALHGLLSNCTYNRISGTSVARDFVELPSQIMENWSMHPEVLKMYAKHYQTGQIITDELIAKIEKADKFNQGFITTEFISAALLDMKWHTLADTKEVDARKFENDALKEAGLIPEIVTRYRSPYFKHIFDGDGYAAGYYAYVWAEVLDADAFEAFKETSLFDQKTAKLFRDNVLSKGGSEDEMELYRRFRGQDPKPEPLLKRRGLL